MSVKRENGARTEHGSSQNDLADSYASCQKDLHPIRTSKPVVDGESASARWGSDIAQEPNERTSLLPPTPPHKYADVQAASAKSKRLSRSNSFVMSSHQRRIQTPERGRSRAQSALNSPLFTRSGARTPGPTGPLHSMIGSAFNEQRLWYDQFTSTDWVRDSIADGYRVLQLRKRKDLAGKLHVMFDAAQGWILMAIIGCAVAALAYFVDVLEGPLFDWKRGYCRSAWTQNQAACCRNTEICEDWRDWSRVVASTKPDGVLINWAIFTASCMLLSGLSCFLTLATKTVIPSHIASTFDEDLSAKRPEKETSALNSGGLPYADPVEFSPGMTYYSAAGSGVAEVKVILSGFVLHGYLGLQTLVIKTLALILSVASGMSLGKEGPFVHIATCIGNIACRLFSKYNLNDAKRREVLSASAASGVAVAFGSPLGGVLFSLEEVSYYFPPKTLFRTFFCCIVAALSLKFSNPYGTHKIVFFEVRYITDWRVFELACFALVGVMGGLLGALFIKASRKWATTFRKIPAIKAYPMLEVLLVAFVTGLLSYWNRYANLAVTELLFELASPCSASNHTGLCPKSAAEIPSIIRYLGIALLIKASLTVVTFGIKVPAGIYVPSMVVGGLMGRIVGHTVQYVALQFPDSCPATGNLESCVTPGVYALVAAGATMCGVTRLSVTLAVILFELTGSLDHVLPFSLGVLCAKWTADFVEPHSIYDSLIDMNSYPFMDNRATPVFDTELEDITPRPRVQRILDVSISPRIKASDLRAKLNYLQKAGELDGGLPIVCDKILIGLIAAPDLEYALDNLGTPEDSTLCLVANVDHVTTRYKRWWMGQVEEESDVDTVSDHQADPTSSHGASSELNHADLTPYIDPAPVALDVHSPMNLVYQCFVKLGLRYICVVEGGEYRGMVHKKVFVRYVKECENHER